MIVWLSRWAGLSWSTRWCGEISYGIYLFGWPISLAVALHTTNPYLVFLGAAPFVLGLALLMRHLVEEPVNRHLKPALMKVLPKMPRPELKTSPLLHTFAYWGMFGALTLFLLYPMAGSLSWFGYQIYKLVAICAGAAVLMGLAKRGTPAPTKPSPAQEQLAVKA